MTLEQVKALSDEELRVKVAELCGWKNVFIDKFVQTLGTSPISGGASEHVPDYPHDLNAMNAAEKLIPSNMRGVYQHYLCEIVDLRKVPLVQASWGCCTASPRQRAEAFGLTMQGE